ncbi:uncharacterized protein LOC128216268 [Mya arenaria]|uniref:uncharacterized protein LOC128216268 n=1 Tax=Mya arenaria TaxID=6604 RepID=UPI0022E0DFED|nr:uncharacterized protein LOC128216268 [Mya arenaria]
MSAKSNLSFVVILANVSWCDFGKDVRVYDAAGWGNVNYYGDVILVHGITEDRAVDEAKVKLTSRRYSNTAEVPQVRTTKYGLNSFRSIAPKLWNSLRQHFRDETNESVSEIGQRMERTEFVYISSPSSPPSCVFISSTSFPTLHLHLFPPLRLHLLSIFSPSPCVFIFPSPPPPCVFISSPSSPTLRLHLLPPTASSSPPPTLGLHPSPSPPPCVSISSPSSPPPASSSPPPTASLSPPPLLPLTLRLHLPPPQLRLQLFPLFSPHCIFISFPSSPPTCVFISSPPPVISSPPPLLLHQPASSSLRPPPHIRLHLLPALGVYLLPLFFPHPASSSPPLTASSSPPPPHPCVFISSPFFSPNLCLHIPTLFSPHPASSSPSPYPAASSSPPLFPPPNLRLHLLPLFSPTLHLHLLPLISPHPASSSPPLLLPHPASSSPPLTASSSPPPLLPPPCIFISSPFFSTTLRLHLLPLFPHCVFNSSPPPRHLRLHLLPLFSPTLHLHLLPLIYILLFLFYFISLHPQPHLLFIHFIFFSSFFY